MNIIRISEIQVRITKCLTMALAAVRHFYNNENVYKKCARVILMNRKLVV